MRNKEFVMNIVDVANSWFGIAQNNLKKYDKKESLSVDIKSCLKDSFFPFDRA